MRLNCEVAVQNWSCTQGLVNTRKAARTSISIGRKPFRHEGRGMENGQNDRNGTVFLMLCTTSNMAGTKYKICGNVENIFGKFVRDGKATIRFKQPTHELYLSKADPGSLYKFLTTLKASTKGELKNIKLPVLTTVKKTDVQKGKTHLNICGAKEYVKTAATLPASLQKLSAVDCHLIRFDTRILALKNLVELNLSRNKLRKLDFSLECLKSLKTLNLSSNLLTQLPSKICRTSKLVTLDLSNNNLSCLPIAFGAMTSLVNVKLSNNNIGSLPSNLGQLKYLRSLNVSNNELVVLPWPVLSELKLNTLDISGNKHLSETRKKTYNFLCETLQEHAGKTIRQKRVQYNQRIVGKYLNNFLDSAKLCSHCRQWCFSCVYTTWKVNPFDLAHEVISSGEEYVNLEMYFCSSNCANSSLKLI